MRTMWTAKATTMDHGSKHALLENALVKHTLGFLLLLAFLMSLALAQAGGALAQTEGRDVREPSPTGGAVPGDVSGTTSDTQFWSEVRKGVQGTVSIPDKKLGVLIQSEGENWRAIINGPVKVYGSWILLGMIAVLALFFALRGRVEVDGGFTGRTVERFTTLDRFAHWLSAVSFLILALTGLNLLYGKFVLLPILGPSAFSALTIAGKYAHNFVGFAFMIGIVLMFVLWVRYNIPKAHDLKWIRQAGGLFNSKIHPPSERFNAGQKVIFWLVVLSGVSLSLSGLALLFPYQFAMFGKTFDILNAIGIDAPETVLPVVEQQLNQVWHAILAIIMMAVILAHIYIGSIGMQGAFSAMGSGRVDENWAAEHHNMWYERLKREGRAPGHSGGQPAE